MTIPNVPALPISPMLLGDSCHSLFRMNSTGAMMPMSKASNIQMTPRRPTRNKILRLTGIRSSRASKFSCANKSLGRWTVDSVDAVDIFPSL